MTKVRTGAPLFAISQWIKRGKREREREREEKVGGEIDEERRKREERRERESVASREQKKGESPIIHSYVFAYLRGVDRRRFP